jgi:hypothetical protein
MRRSLTSRALSVGGRETSREGTGPGDRAADDERLHRIGASSAISGKALAHRIAGFPAAGQVWVKDRKRGFQTGDPELAVAEILGQLADH